MLLFASCPASSPVTYHPCCIPAKLGQVHGSMPTHPNKLLDTRPTSACFFVGDVEVAGIHELVGNALIVDGEPPRKVDLRGDPLPNVPQDDEGEEGESNG